DLLLDEHVGQGGDRREMEEGVDRLAVLDPVVLDLDRLFDLDNHLRVLPDLLGRGDDAGAHRLVLRIGDEGARAGSARPEHLVATGGEGANEGRDHAHPILVNLDFLGNSDDHEEPPRRRARCPTQSSQCAIGGCEIAGGPDGSKPAGEDGERVFSSFSPRPAPSPASPGPSSSRRPRRNSISPCPFLRISPSTAGSPARWTTPTPTVRAPG